MDEHSATLEHQNWKWNDYDTSNVTTTPAILRSLGPFDRYIDQMPLMGYPGPIFNLIHILALASLAASVLVSVLLIIGLCFPRNPKQRVNEPASSRSATQTTATTVSGATQMKSKNRTSFWKWHISERLVIYLAVADTFYGISHSLDHGYMLYAKANPPDRVCSFFAFVLQEFIFAQWIIILYTAVNACSLIVFTKKLDLGWMDWKLILAAFGSPLVLGAVTLGMGLLGQSGAWCYADLRTKAGLIFLESFSIAQVLVFGVIAIAYGLILVKIRQSSKHLSDEKASRYRNSAKIMIIFVFVFFLQWWSPALCNMWSFFQIPPIATYFLVVVGANLGGVYNSIAYTLIRRRFTKVASSEQTAA